MWDPKYQGKVAVATNPNVNGSMIALTFLANRLAGAADGLGSFDPGFDYLEKITANILTWNPRPNQYWLVSQKRALLAVGWNSRSQSQMDALDGYATTVPSEGTVAVPILIARVADRPNGEAAQAFINYSLGPRAQQAFFRGDVLRAVQPEGQDQRSGARQDSVALTRHRRQAGPGGLGGTDG